jgi:hypothetical protein
MSPVDFVAVGHVTLDQTARGTRPGGAAYYTAMTAHRLGLAWAAHVVRAISAGGVPPA